VQSDQPPPSGSQIRPSGHSPTSTSWFLVPCEPDRAQHAVSSAAECHQPCGRARPAAGAAAAGRAPHTADAGRGAPAAAAAGAAAAGGARTLRQRPHGVWWGWVGASRRRLGAATGSCGGASAHSLSQDARRPGWPASGGCPARARVAARAMHPPRLEITPTYLSRSPCVLQAPTSVEQSIEEGVNVTGEFCSLTPEGKRLRDRSMGEMEQVGGVFGVMACAGAPARVVSCLWWACDTRPHMTCTTPTPPHTHTHTHVHVPAGVSGSHDCVLLWRQAQAL
jgi:hypothetical protein